MTADYPTQPSPAKDQATGLLPVGLADQLAPRASVEARLQEELIAQLEANGYERVKPPLLEFEAALLADAPAKLRRRSFRVVDPLSRETLVLRSDMTGQIERLASTRLAQQPRPLRLCYAGQVVRVTGSDLRPERQFSQVGAEIIGLEPSQGAFALVEVASLAARGMAMVFTQGLVADLVLPNLVKRLCAQHKHELTQGLQAAIAARDPKMIAEQSCGEVSDALQGLMRAAGPWREALAQVPDALFDAQSRAQFVALAEGLEANVDGLSVTFDPVEQRGFEYHQGPGFVFFAANSRGELGRGGLYITRAGELAAGMTHYLDSLARGLEASQPPQYVLVPADERQVAAQLIGQGYRVRRVLEPGAAPSPQLAQASGCKLYWDGTAVQAV